MSRMLMWIVVAVILAAGGCARPAYVNIPRVPGSAATASPDHPTAVNVQIAALDHLLTREPPAGRFAIALPDGASSRTYSRVVEALPRGARPAEDVETTAAGDVELAADGRAADPPPMPIYEVAQVQVSGLRAQVDIIRPDADGRPQLVSVYLKTDIEGWYGERMRPWHVDVDQALRIARPHPSPAAPID